MCELIVHRMVNGEYEFNLSFSRDSPFNHFKGPVDGEYKANLVAVRSYQDEIGYLGKFDDVYCLLSSAEEQEESRIA